MVLVGMMGAGKSTVGRALATRLGRPFVDLDEAIEATAGHTVAELFATEGEDGFRDREVAALDGVLAASNPAVVAAGGGVVLRDENRDRLRAVAQVVWLRAQPATLEARVGGAEGRPLLAGEDVPRRVRTIAEARTSLYQEVADVIVDTDDRNVDDVVAEIEQVLA